MKICFLHHSFIVGSGTDALIYQYAKRLSENHEVSVLAFRTDDYQEGKFRVTKLSIPFSESRIATSVAAPLLWNWKETQEKLNDFDTVVTMLYPTCLIPASKTWKRKYKWIHIEWGTPEGVWSFLTENAYAKLAKWGQGKACKKADSVLVGSRFVQQWVKDNYNRDSEFMYLDGIDFGLFDKSKYTNRRDTNNILYVGRVSPHKNLEMLIEAMPYVLRQRPDATLTIVGSLSFRSYLERLLKSVEELKLPKGAVSFKGVIPWSRLPEYYANCSVYCSPSLWEGFLKSECYAFEKPFVAFNRTSNSEMVKDRETGLLVDSINSENLAMALILLLLSPDRALKWGRQGYEWAKENLDIDIITKNLERVLEEV